MFTWSKWVHRPLGVQFLDLQSETCSIIDLLAPATGKTLSCGQRIRITGISPLRGSLRAVSGSTIVILTVIAYVRSCLTVSDGILARPPLPYSGWRVMAYLTSGYHQD